MGYIAYEHPHSLELKGDTFLIAKALGFESLMNKKAKTQQIDFKDLGDSYAILNKEFNCYTNKLGQAYEVLDKKLRKIIHIFKENERKQMMIWINGDSILFLIEVTQLPFFDMTQHEIFSERSYYIYQRAEEIALDLPKYFN